MSTFALLNFLANCVSWEKNNSYKWNCIFYPYLFIFISFWVHASLAAGYNETYGKNGDDSCRHCACFDAIAKSRIVKLAYMKLVGFSIHMAKLLPEKKHRYDDTDVRNLSLNSVIILQLLLV